jgi:hypothetical protein
MRALPHSSAQSFLSQLLDGHPHTCTRRKRTYDASHSFFEGIQLNSYRSFFSLLSTDKKYIGSLWAKEQKNEMKK